MIPRLLQHRIESALAKSPAVGLLGPRQVGKTTLARGLTEALNGTSNVAEYLDLENPADLARLEDPLSYLRSKSDRLVVLDEIQRAPQLFEILRVLIDEREAEGGGRGHFLLLGSASIDLVNRSSESLAGRLAFLELGPFGVTEVDGSQGSQERLWVRGGFPRSYLADDDEDSAQWRADFIRTYLERDIREFGVRIPTETLRRFWTMLAHRQGALLNLSELARSLAVDGKTVSRYLDLLVDLLLVRRLPPVTSNTGKRLVRSPKTYVRDSGLVHSLLRIDDLDALLSHPIAGASWEGHAIEALLAVAPTRADARFYRSAGGAELDLVLDLPGRERWAIEVKRSSAPKLSRGFHSGCADVEATRALVVHPGTDRYPKGDGIEAIGLVELCRELAEL